ncbi:transposase [Bacillus sp. CGMCC 1.16607]|uniref:transposase n=1 Tax=Bacillus sp. CGMCC 1.16607 TaxID=3351842 RepID=UPI003645742E
MYGKRKSEVDCVFGHIKGNWSFLRWSLRGRTKVHVEFGIVALANNFRKCSFIKKIDHLNKV